MTTAEILTAVGNNPSLIDAMPPDVRKAVAILATRGMEGKKFTQYRNDPVGYIENELGTKLWDRQIEAAEALLTHRQVLVMAATGVGKTVIAACLAQWFTDVAPAIGYTTAPSWPQVERLLWKEIRIRRRPGMGGNLAPRACELRYGDDHFLIGVNAEKPEGLQGQHHERMLFVMDEGPGVPLWFWLVADRLCVSPQNYKFVIGNPFLASGPFFDASNSDDWHVIQISALEHPNVLAALAGEPEPYPGAVSLGHINNMVKSHCEVSDASAGNIEWPPNSGIWYKPDAEFEAGVLGRFPTTATDTVIPGAWVEESYGEKALRKPEGDVVIGVDIARFGDDKSELHVRQGRCSLHHVALSGADTMRVAFEVKRLAEQYKAQRINILVTGMGGGVADVLRSWDLPVCEINEAGKAIRPEKYPNVRNEMWWIAREDFYKREYDLTRLDRDTRKSLRNQLAAPTWQPDTRGRRVVESKEDTKKRIGRSPDGADAFLASHYPTRYYGKRKRSKFDMDDDEPKPRPTGAKSGSYNTGY